MPTQCEIRYEMAEAVPKCKGLFLKSLEGKEGRERLPANRRQKKSGHRDFYLDQTPSDRIDSKAKSFKGHRAQQCGGSMFPEDHEGRGLAVIIDELSPANAAYASPAVCKDSGAFIEVRDSQ